MDTRILAVGDMRLDFDRGTIILRNLPDEAHARSLPGVVWDPRVAAPRAPAFRYGELWHELRRRSGRRPCGPRLDKTEAWFPPELRAYQASAIHAWHGAGRRGLVVLPTGSGKTRLALGVLARLALPALCVVPTRALMHQWLDAVRSVYGGPVGQLGDGHRTVRPVTVATYESAYRAMHRIGGRFAVLVIDEAHHFGARMRDEALEMCVAPYRLGLTATPSDEPATVERLEALIGPVAYRLGVDDLAGTFLAEYALVPVEVELTRDERARYERERAAFRAVHTPFKRLAPNASWVAFTRSAQKTDAGRRALAAWRRSRSILAYPAGKARALERLLYRHRGSRILVFTSNNTTAYAIAREHLVMPLTCDIKKAERTRALERFRRGEIRALVSARVLNEGIDVPDADVAIVVGGTLGAREHVQRIGRLLRPSEGKTATVYELVVRHTTEVGQAQRRNRGLASQATG